MQSRLATAATRSCWAFSVVRNREFVAGPSITGRTADSAIHSVEVEAGVHYGEPEAAGNGTVAEPHSHEAASGKKPSHSHEAASGTKPSKDTETVPLLPPKPPHIPSPRLESYCVNQPLNPHFLQKRENSTNAAVQDLICAGFDGTPLPEGKEEEQSKKYETAENDKEYYSHHKASPLSEIKLLDTRKPIARATDGTSDAAVDYGSGKNVIRWRPEQLDTAEEALRRAVQIFRQNAMRGDPDVFPHSRILRELRGEWF